MQWFARITDYADQLLDDLEKLEGKWPERVVSMQRNWIGRSDGAEVTFQIADSNDSVTVFTTRIDTIYGANAIILAPEHALLAVILEGKPQRDEVLDFAEKLKQEQRSGRVDELEKHGKFTGAFAINPFNQERLPIWIANFVLAHYGTGAIMAVPAGDGRDFEFARKYDLPFRQIKLNAEGREIPAEEIEVPDESWTTTVNTGQWSGLSSEEANRVMTEYAEAHGFGRGAITYKLRDWGISRQRYWGTPVPMIHCERDGIVPVPDDQLPVTLPKGVNLKVEGGSPLDHVPEFVNVSCPKCGGPAKRDTDTMDTFMDSNWYYFRYCDPHNDTQPFDPEKIAYWFPVDQYIGGIEHAVLHLIYTRYWTKVMRDMGLVKFDEPVAHHLGPIARVDQVQHRMLDAADVLIDRHPVRDFLRIERHAVVMRIAVAEVIPVRIDERVHRVRVALRRASALRADHVDILRHVIERRSAFDFQVHALRQHDRQLVVGHGHDAVALAVNHRNRRAPVALTRDAPIAQLVGDRALPEPVSFGVLGHPPIRFFGRQAAPLAGVDRSGPRFVGVFHLFGRDLAAVSVSA